MVILLWINSYIIDSKTQAPSCSFWDYFGNPIFYCNHYSSIAQKAERLAVNQRVVGSIPTGRAFM